MHHTSAENYLVQSGEGWGPGLRLGAFQKFNILVTHAL